MPFYYITKYIIYNNDYNYLSNQQKSIIKILTSSFFK